ncbi:DNA (cytosine-5-)-methyltransferase [Fulvivirga ulvae]|uniref:DNA (cytosine-5-)-methyltransferase n=1 Tax=Fulvivirga ulvae TaxID=2904245 RepID=UPI001F3BA3B9|nr:DNA (cytosine-5-)-methyltransferase [Fulvivirga ulvae]UII31110.1 DNA (cytosine-5-)-methyltransferase [Fulvivirga ulvae]
MKKYSVIRKRYKIEAEKAKDEGMAFFTHYLQNHTNGISGYFRNDADRYHELLNEESKVKEPDFQYMLPIEWDVPFPPPEKPTFTFIDLFAGIGGFRIAFQNQGGKCIFSSEWNRYAKKTYEANFGEVPFGDITKIDEKKIPDHDILLGGFPCQPFSIAGVSKKNSLGRNHGFLDETQGTLFYDIVRIIKEKRPKAFLLENVKNLRSHDKGKTYKIIIEALKELNYITFDKVLDARYYVPQHRERIFIAGFNKDYFSESILFEFPETPDQEIKFRDILEKRPDPKYTLTDQLWNYLQQYAEKHRQKGNGFGFGMTDPEGISRTLSARYYKDGSEILIAQRGKNPRRLTPKECKRLMGYPENFRIKDIGVSDTQLYKQFGNSVAVPVVSDIAEKMMNLIQQNLKPHVSKNSEKKEAMFS